jgi:hypothetical protein
MIDWKRFESSVMSAGWSLFDAISSHHTLGEDSDETRFGGRLLNFAKIQTKLEFARTTRPPKNALFLLYILSYKLNNPLLLLPNGYTTIALKNNPTVIPIAI